MGDIPDTNRPPKREVIDDEYESANNQPAAKIVKREEEPDPSFEVLELREKVIELEQKLVESQQNELMWKEKYERAVRSNASDAARLRHLESLVDKKPVIAVKAEVEEETEHHVPPSQLITPSPHMNPPCLHRPEIAELQKAVAASNPVVLPSTDPNKRKSKDKKPVIAVKTEVDEEGAEPLHVPPSHLIIPSPHMNPPQCLHRQEIVELQKAVAASNPIVLPPDPNKRKSKGKRPKPSTNGFVFVHNLSAKTSRVALENLFSQRFDVVKAKVAHECNLAHLVNNESASTLMSRAIVRFLSQARPIPTDLSPPASMGVVQLCSRELAWDAIKTFQGVQLDGQSIELTMDFNKELLAAFETIRVESPQLLVNNVPLQVSPSEIKLIFSSCIGFKSLHMPTNANGSHHGFGFIDFEFWVDARRARSKLLFPMILHGEQLAFEIVDFVNKEEMERILLGDSLNSTNAEETKGSIVRRTSK